MCKVFYIVLINGRWLINDKYYDYNYIIFDVIF